MAKKYNSYYGSYQPEHTVTYYKKQLQHSRGILIRNKNYQTAKGYAEYIKEKYNIADYTEKQFRDILSVMDLSYAEKNRRLAAYYEREYKIITGQYDYERKKNYLDRIKNNLEYGEELPQDVLDLWEEFVTPETYNAIADKLPNGDIIFANSGDKEGVGGRAVDITDDIYDVIVEGARLKGYNVRNMKDLLMQYYDYDEDEAEEVISWDLGT